MFVWTLLVKTAGESVGHWTMNEMVSPHNAVPYISCYMSLLHPLTVSTHVVGTCSLDHTFKLQMLHNLHIPLILI